MTNRTQHDRQVAIETPLANVMHVMQCRPAGQSHLAIPAALVPDPAGLGLAALVGGDVDGATLVPDLAGLGFAGLADGDGADGTGPFPGVETSASVSASVRQQASHPASSQDLGPPAVGH